MGRASAEASSLQGLCHSHRHHVVLRGDHHFIAIVWIRTVHSRHGWQRSCLGDNTSTALRRFSTRTSPRKAPLSSPPICSLQYPKLPRDLAPTRTSPPWWRNGCMGCAPVSSTGAWTTGTSCSNRFPPNLFYTDWQFLTDKHGKELLARSATALVGCNL